MEVRVAHFETCRPLNQLDKIYKLFRAPDGSLTIWMKDDGINLQSHLSLRLALFLRCISLLLDDVGRTPKF